MNKKLVSILMALIMLMTSSFAFAAVPSVTVPAAVVTVQVATSTGVAVAENFEIAEVESSETVQAVFQQIVAVAETENVITYFDEETVNTMTAFLPPEVDLANANVQMDEFFAIDALNYDTTYGDIVASFEFATAYEDDAILLAMLGVIDEEAVEGEEPVIAWTPLETAVNEGKVEVTLTQDVFESIATGEAFIALLHVETEE